MYRDNRVSVCLPCRSEAKHLKKVVSRIPKFVDEIIVVSNKSVDNTIEVAKKLGLKVYEDNRTIKGIGYGFAHITAIQNATGDIIVGADSDATYPLEDLAKILDVFIDDKQDFISCKRYPLQSGTKIPMKQRVGVWLLNKEVRIVHGLKIDDILSGMWVFKKDIAKYLNLKQGDWNLSPEIKIKAAKHPKVSFKELSINQHLRMGESHQKYFKTGMSHAFWIFKTRFQQD